MVTFTKIAGLDYDALPAEGDKIVIRWGNDGMLIRVTVEKVSEDGTSKIIAFEQSNPAADAYINNAMDRKSRLAWTAANHWKSKGHEVTVIQI